MFNVADELLDRLRLEQIRIHSASKRCFPPSHAQGRTSGPAPSIEERVAGPGIIRGFYWRKRRKARQRASGSPFIKSLMTATDAAPASSTDAALSIVMPPIATAGSPCAVAAADARVTTSRPTAV